MGSIFIVVVVSFTFSLAVLFWPIGMAIRIEWNRKRHTLPKLMKIEFFFVFDPVCACECVFIWYTRASMRIFSSLRAMCVLVFVWIRRFLVVYVERTRTGAISYNKFFFLLTNSPARFVHLYFRMPFSQWNCCFQYFLLPSFFVYVPCSMYCFACSPFGLWMIVVFVLSLIPYHSHQIHYINDCYEFNGIVFLCIFHLLSSPRNRREYTSKIIVFLFVKTHRIWWDNFQKWADWMKREWEWNRWITSECERRGTGRRRDNNWARNG